MLISALTNDSKSNEGELNRLENENIAKNKTLISKLQLPKVTINLQIKTNKLSIETTVNL
jgi:hypothetical protein